MLPLVHLHHAGAAAAGAEPAALQADHDQRRRERHQAPADPAQQAAGAERPPETQQQRAAPRQHLAPAPDAGARLGSDETHRQSPNALLPEGQRGHGGGVGAQDARAEAYGVHEIGRPSSRPRSAGEKPPSGPIRIAQGSPASTSERVRAGPPRLVAEHQPPPRRPVRQHRVELLQFGHLGHEGAAALFGGLDGMGLQPVLTDALGIGELGLHRQDPRRAHLGGLLDDEIGARLLDRREEQPQVGRQPAGAGSALQHLQPRRRACRPRRPRPAIRRRAR